LTGASPEISYENTELKERILNDKRLMPQYRTAKRLALHGYQYHFQEDERHYCDPVTGLEQTVGLADGVVRRKLWEIKTLQCSFNGSRAVEAAFRNASHKERIDVLVLDNFDSNQSDADVIVWAKIRMKQKGFARVLFIDKHNHAYYIK